MGRSMAISRLNLRSWLPRLRVLLLAGLLAAVCCAARATVIDGVQLPPAVQIAGKTLQLNGYGLRTYSLLGIHIYVAGLYLEHPSTDANAILQSPETKLLTVRFEHGVSADAARRAWRTGLANNCYGPCRLDPQEVETFLTKVPAMHAGDDYSLLFTAEGVSISADGKDLGSIMQPQFAEAILATFLGPRPASPQLKQELLQGHS
jgi:hypothetical protein